MTGPLNNPAGQPVVAPFPAPAAVARVDARKGRRSAVHMQKVQDLIERLRHGPMVADEVCTLLKVGASVARKYLVELNKASITASEVEENSARKTHVLIASSAKIEAFIQSVKLIPVLPRKPARTALAMAQASGRRFHFARDDEHVAVKVPKSAPAPDPLALPASFFRASDDSIPAPVRTAPDPKPAPTGFAALDVHFVRRAPDPVKIKAAAERKAERQSERLRKDLQAECREMASFFGRLAGAMA